jgi:hypothetical protein
MKELAAINKPNTSTQDNFSPNMPTPIATKTNIERIL